MHKGFVGGAPGRSTIGKGGSGSFGHHKSRLPWVVAAAALAIAIIILAFFGVQSGAQTITQTGTLSLKQNQTTYLRVFNGSTIAMRLQSSTGTGATIFVSAIPILFGPITAVYLSSGSSANLSSSGTRLADMNVKLNSVSAGSAQVQITPLQSSLGIRVSGNINLLNPVTLALNLHATSPVGITTTTVTSTTSIATTTVAVNTTASKIQQAMTIANQSSIGALMSKYRTLFRSDVQCTPGLYNSTYLSYYFAAPSGPNSFANVSIFTPTDITVAASPLTKANTYGVVYSTVAPLAVTSGPAVTMVVDVSSHTFANVTLTGIFQGLNYTRLNESYTFQSHILGNPCAALISKP